MKQERFGNVPHITENGSFVVAKSTKDDSLMLHGGVDIRDYLWKTWQSIFDEPKYGNHRHFPDWFDRIMKHYMEPGRYYHTPTHLYEIFELLRLRTDHRDGELNLVLSMTQDKALKLATFFHDAIYDPKSKTNERDSAALFEEFWDSEGVPDSLFRAFGILPARIPMQETLYKITKTLILSTKKHQVLNADFESLQQLFLDLDMAVLGKYTTRAYLDYAAAIRQEYSHLPAEVYCNRRAAFLSNLLQERIFRTSVFQREMEDHARRNLQAEVELLREGKIPERSLANCS